MIISIFLIFGFMPTEELHEQLCVGCVVTKDHPLENNCFSWEEGIRGS